MTSSQIRQRLIRIAAEAKAGDFEAAGSEERRLHIDVLKAVAEGSAGAIEATTALASLELEFVRRSA